jgi:hypothetical protein
MIDLDALKRAIEQDDFNAAVSVLDQNKQLVTQVDTTGATALHHAAFYGRRRIAKLLVERGADVNQRDAKFNATPAGWAIEHLRELGGHLSIELDDLAFAIETGDSKWVRRLLTRFPRMRTAVYRDRITFREIAAGFPDPQIAELFDDTPA